MKLGIIARSDDTGLGNQTRELTKMLNPSKILLIDSTPFNGNDQHPNWYSRYDTLITRGFPNDAEMMNFLDGIDVVLSCELFYNTRLISYCKQKGIKTVLQYNYEFLDNLQNLNLDLPDVLLSPSTWNIDKIINFFGKDCKVTHLPPPSDFELFKNNREANLSTDHKRIVHIAGKIAAKDRNGTDTVIEMLKYSKADYQLVVKVQKGQVIECNDPRLKIEYNSPENREDLYKNFDAMILPRRYAGLCLPMNEALMSGLPVFMTDISPNNAVLPPEWLVETSVIDVLMTRTLLDVHNADPVKLAQLVDTYINNYNKKDWKEKAIEIGYSNFAVENLKDKYLEILG